MKIVNWLYFMLILALFSACGGAAVGVEDFDIELYKPLYAEGFRLLAAEESESTIIEINNPWQGAAGVATRLFIARGGERAPRGFEGQTIQGEAQRIVCMSSTQIAMLDGVDCVERVVGVSGLEYVSNEYIAANAERIADVGYDGNVNYERLVALNPDLVLIYALSGVSPMEAKLKELDIPYTYIGEYLEESPLGKAEWMVAVAEMVGKRELGESHFAQIPRRYNELKTLASGVEAAKRPKVMINTPYGDSWVMAPRGSYVAQLIADAAGDYIYINNSHSTRSESIDVEEAYLMASRADLWINLGTLSTFEELESLCPKFVDIPCVVRGELYNSNKRRNASGGNDYWESGVVHPDIVLRDLITIFHPDLATDSLVYYKKME